MSLAFVWRCYFFRTSLSTALLLYHWHHYYTALPANSSAATTVALEAFHTPRHPALPSYPPLSLPLLAVSFVLSPPRATYVFLVPPKRLKCFTFPSQAEHIRNDVDYCHPRSFCFAAQTAVMERRPKASPIRRILGKISLHVDVFSGSSSDECDVRQVPARG